MSQSSWKVIVFFAVRKQWKVGSGEVGMEVPLVALAARMTRWGVGGRRSHPFVSFFALRWAATMGWSASAVCNMVVTSVKNPMAPMWSCGAGLGSVGRLVSVQQQVQTHALLRTKREWCRGDSW